jgi:hypothetical protein
MTPLEQRAFVDQENLMLTGFFSKLLKERISNPTILVCHQGEFRLSTASLGGAGNAIDDGTSA